MYLAHFVKYCLTMQKGRGRSTSKTQEVRPMSAGDVIALHLLIIAAITLGITIGRHLKK